jgi:hypothetical protein
MTTMPLSGLIGVVLFGCSVAFAETVEMTAGPDASVTFDTTLWKPLASLRPAEPGSIQSMTWELQPKKEVQITVASHPEKQSASEYRKSLLDLQKFRGDPADFVREEKQEIGGREWLVMEFRNQWTRPSRSEITYFLSTPDGYVTFFVIGDEANLPQHRTTIAEFLKQVALK